MHTINVIRHMGGEAMTRTFSIRMVAALAGAATLFAVTLPFGVAHAELKTWRHGIVEAKSDAGFIMMAAENGFAEKEGLKVEIVQFKGDALALKAMLAGELDSYEGSPGGPLVAASRGADLKVIGCHWPKVTYGIFSKPDIASPKDLKGKSFAISNPGALPDLLARAVLEQNGITADQVKFAIMGSDADRYRALSAGVVDVATASTEFAALNAKTGMKLLVHANDVVPKYIRFCFYASSKTRQNRPAELTSLLTAEMKALKYALANRDAVISLSNKITGAKPDDTRAAYIYDEVKKLSAVDPTMTIPVDHLQWMQELFMKTGNLTKAVDLSQFVDESFRKKALEAVGK